MKKRESARAGVWQNVSMPRLVASLIYAAATLGCAMAVTTLEGRYPRGFAMAFFVVFLILLIRSLKKLLTDRLQSAIARALEKAFSWTFRPVTLAVQKVATWLGVGRWRGWCEDEKSFIGRAEWQRSTRRRRIKNDLKWSEQQTNAQRVRFLYIEYLIKRIKGGYLARPQLTPDEIADELVSEKEERMLFDAYDAARYAKTPDISDETVQALTALTKKR